MSPFGSTRKEQRPVWTRKRLEDADRREFLQFLCAGAVGLLVPGGMTLGSERSGSKPLRGIFPIAQTPFTAGGKLDVDGLVEEVKFVDRGGVHGFISGLT